MTKAKKGVKRAVKKKAKRSAAGVKKPVFKVARGGPRLAEEPPLDPDPIKRHRKYLADQDLFDDHRGDYTIPNQPIYEMVRGVAPLPGAFIFAMAEFERQARWLRALFKGILIMLRLPGGFDFEDDELPDDIDDRLRTFDRHLLLNVLERCLILLVAKGMSVRWTRLRRGDKAIVREIMSEVVGDAPYRMLLMSIELQDMLEALETNHLLNVVAECFDLLVMVPILQEQAAALFPDEWRRGAGE